MLVRIRMLAALRRVFQPFLSEGCNLTNRNLASSQAGLLLLPSRILCLLLQPLGILSLLCSDPQSRVLELSLVLAKGWEDAQPCLKRHAVN